MSDDDEVAFGWRYWGAVRPDEPPALVSPICGETFIDLGYPTPSVAEITWEQARKDAPPCRRGCEPLMSEPGCACGLFAYRTLEDSLIWLKYGIAISPVVGRGRIAWSTSDPRATAWRAEQIEICGLIVPDFRKHVSEPLAPEAQAVADALDVPLWATWKIQARNQKVSIVRAVEFADELGLPNVRRDGPIRGRTPDGPTQIFSRLVGYFPP